ncbi:RHS repeat-associated core domain-containing protein [Allocatelliglobosispora scoriae]|uniref:RHS repeat-associated core domain-containing protein n=1 Tax=Allocatelliglobosispora scoriae TaxID=643052 RepID=UPI0016216541|nr:RHS repeat-associated core domain-containing protein [Allocatelliglobosispora scoriae]
MPCGGERGTTPTWPNGKGFGGGDIDPTGLVHVGAREYDPATGRFISVGPIFDLKNCQTWNAYTYSNSSPVTHSDPSGLKMVDPDDGRLPGKTLVHITAVALRMHALKMTCPGAHITGEMWGNAGGPDLVGWNCSAIAGGPDVVWVWEVKAIGRVTQPAQKIAAATEIAKHVAQVNADPRAEGRAPLSPIHRRWSSWPAHPTSPASRSTGWRIRTRSRRSQDEQAVHLHCRRRGRRHEQVLGAPGSTICATRPRTPCTRNREAKTRSPGSSSLSSPAEPVYGGCSDAVRCCTRPRAGRAHPLQV